MRERLSSVKMPTFPPGAPRVLMLFGDIDPRVMVRRFCETLAPDCQLFDVASVTDAVLQVLATPVDIVLVDASLAGDLLHSLALHVRRTSPRARLAVFGIDADAAAQPKQRLRLAVLPWTRLESTLMDLLRVRTSPFADPRQ